MFLNKLVIERSDIVLVGAPLVEAPHGGHVDVLEPMRSGANGDTDGFSFYCLSGSSSLIVDRSSYSRRTTCGGSA